MSYYSVKLNWYESGTGLVEAVDVYDPTEKTMVLIDPVVTLTVGEAGNFEFTVPRNHVFYDKFKAYECSVAVFEEEDCIFYGRLLPPIIDTFGQKKFHAEGALAFLNDCILPPTEMGEQITAAEYIEQVLGYYNQYAGARPDRAFVFDDLSNTDLGNITIYDPQPWNYQSAKDIIVSYLYQYCGGYFYIEFTDFDELEFKWRYKLTEENSQVIQLGVNLLDLAQNGKEIYTAAIAKGGKDLDGEQVGMLSPIYTTANVVRYGLICKYLEYPSATVVDALEAYCENFLEEQQFDGYTFEATAADQHPLTSTFKKYGIGQLVNLKSAELGIDVTIPITRIVYKLYTAVKEITVGVTDARLRAISVASAKSEAQMEQMADEMECCSEDKQDSVIKGNDGNDYAIDIDTSGETPVVTAVKLISRIEFTEIVEKYKNGDTFDHSDYTVTGYYGDGITTDVTEQCSYSVDDGYVFNGENDPLSVTATLKRTNAKSLTAVAPIKAYTSMSGTHLVVNSMMTVSGVNKNPGNRLYSGYFHYTLDIHFKNTVTLDPLFVDKPDGSYGYNGVQYASSGDIRFDVAATLTYDYAVAVNASYEANSGTSTLINTEAIKSRLFDLFTIHVGDNVSVLVPEGTYAINAVTPRSNYPDVSYTSLFCGDMTAYDAYGGGDYKVEQVSTISFT